MPVGPAPVVDVGIPAHGRPRFVAEAVESVLAQTFGAWRLVVSEDGPGAGPVADAVAPYLGDPRVRYSSTGTPVGAAGNMTALITSGTAPYVALLHDDDRWEPDFLARRVAFLERHRQCAFVFGRSMFIDEHGNRVGSRPPALPPGIHPPERFVPAMLRRNIVPIATVLVRRSAYEAVGPTFDARFPHIYDYEMWLRIGARFPVGRLDVTDAEWRRHGAQSSYDGHERGAELLAFLEHAEQLVARELPELCIPERRRRYVRGRRLLSAGPRRRPARRQRRRGALRAPGGPHLAAARGQPPPRPRAGERGVRATRTPRAPHRAAQRPPERAPTALLSSADAEAMAGSGASDATHRPRFAARRS